MGPVTEIAVLPFKPETNIPSILPQVTATIAKQPGCLRVRSSKQLESPDTINLFIDWQDISFHNAFMASEQYGPFLEPVKASLAAPPSLYHVPFEPFPPIVLDNGAGGWTAEVLHAYFPADEASDAGFRKGVLATFELFWAETLKVAPRGLTGEWACGWTVEDLDFEGQKCRAVVAVFGWESVDAHMAYRGMKEFARTEKDENGVDVFTGTIMILRGMKDTFGLKGMKVYHVSCETHA